MTFEETYRVLTYGPAMINVQADPVFPEEYADLPKLREYMIAVMRRFDGVGLAAPQIGVFKQFMVFENEDGNVMDFVNPHLARMYGKELEGPEGCLSIPPSGNECLVPRCRFVDVESATAYSPEVVQSWSLQDLTARIVQHEMDHLTGTFFTDRVSEKKRREVMEKFAHWKQVRKAQTRFPQKGTENVDAGIVAAHGSQSRLS